MSWFRFIPCDTHATKRDQVYLSDQANVIKSIFLVAQKGIISVLSNLDSKITKNSIFPMTSWRLGVPVRSSKHYKIDYLRYDSTKKYHTAFE